MKKLTDVERNEMRMWTGINCETGDFIYGIDGDHLIDYMINYNFTEDDMREFWNAVPSEEWMNLQGHNMSEDFKREAERNWNNNWI